jgi:hypothetical protein
MREISGCRDSWVLLGSQQISNHHVRRKRAAGMHASSPRPSCVPVIGFLFFYFPPLAFFSLNSLTYFSGFSINASRQPEQQT